MKIPGKMKISQLLIPIDFSECSRNALVYALKLNKYFKAKITMVNCYTPSMPVAGLKLQIDTDLEKGYKAETEKKFQKLEKEIPELQIIPYEYIIKMKLAPQGIIETASKSKTNLIVMGTRGTNTKLQTVFGSNAYSVIKDSKIPVLAIPKDAKFKTLDRILVAADYKDIRNTNPLELVREIAGISDSRLEILHINGKIKKMKESELSELLELRKLFSGMDFSFHQLHTDKIDEGIETFVNQYRINMVVLLHRKHNLPESIFKKRITRKIALHFQVPILALPELPVALPKKLIM
jgi:nucleotide-binding universal stress UspA family protein